VIDVAAQLVIAVTVAPLNVTVLEPCVAPKFAPEIVTDVPATPDAGERLVMFGWANDVPNDARQKTTTANSCHFLFMFSVLDLHLAAINTTTQTTNLDTNGEHIRAIRQE
jgi:hypothetical protein